MLNEFARLHAHVCGDGWISKMIKQRSAWDIKRYNRNKTTYTEWQIGYSNKEPYLLEEFKGDVGVLTNASIEARSNEVRVRNKKLFNELKKVGAGNSRSWIGNKILLASKKIKREWLRAFFDDEATIEVKEHKRIRVKSVNLKGLSRVKKLLGDLGILASITGPNSDNTHYLTISNKNSLKRFKFEIGFLHPTKSNKLLFLSNESPDGRIYYKRP